LRNTPPHYYTDLVFSENRSVVNFCSHVNGRPPCTRSVQFYWPLREFLCVRGQRTHPFRVNFGCQRLDSCMRIRQFVSRVLREVTRTTPDRQKNISSVVNSARSCNNFNPSTEIDPQNVIQDYFIKDFDEKLSTDSDSDASDGDLDSSERVTMFHRPAVQRNDQMTMNAMMSL